MASFEVRVVDDEDDGLSGRRVTLSFTGLLRGTTAEEHTDSRGCATFDGYEEGEVKVFVDGSDCGTYDYEDGGSITVTP